MNKVILITGASSGMGFETLKLLIQQGYVVYGSARKDDDLQKINKHGGRMVKMEMTEYSTLENAISKIIKEKGKIDVLINNAGYGLYGSVEEIPIDKAKHQLDVNLFGLARLHN